MLPHCRQMGITNYYWKGGNKEPKDHTTTPTNFTSSGTHTYFTSSQLKIFAKPHRGSLCLFFFFSSLDCPDSSVLFILFVCSGLVFFELVPIRKLLASAVSTRTAAVFESKFD